MRWADERYVRVYTRDTGEWLALGWEAQALFLFALRKADRAGIVQTGKARARGLAGMTGMPLDVVERVLPLLLDDGCMREAPNAYIIPNFIAAQETPTSDAQRKRDQRERDRDKAVADGAVGSKAGLDAESTMSRRTVTTDSHDLASRHGVTQGGHAMESHDVTSGHAGTVTPNRAVPSRAEPTTTASRADGQEDLLDDDMPASPKGPNPEALREIWNRLAPPKGLQRWEAMSKKRAGEARAALVAVPDLARWEAWLTHELLRPFNLGVNDRGWMADVDWLLRAKTRDLVADFNPAVAVATRTASGGDVPRVGLRPVPPTPSGDKPRL
jgi:hypothetical protein